MSENEEREKRVCSFHFNHNTPHISFPIKIMVEKGPNFHFK